MTKRPQDPRPRLTRRRVLGAALATVTLALALPRTARADGVEVVAQLERTKAAVGEGVRFIVEVSQEGRGGPTPAPELPDFGKLGIDVRGPNTFPRSSTVWINGQVTRQSSVRYTYYLIPSQPGTFKLPVHVKVGGDTISAPRIPVLEVTGAAAPDEPIKPGDARRPQSAPGDIFLWLRVDKPRPYVGEQIIYEIELYESVGRQLDISLTSLPGFQDFWTEELPTSNEARVEVIEGTPFRARTIFRRALFPQRAGALTIGRPQADIGIIAGVFAPVQRMRRISGQSLELEVRPLPAKGRPPGFSPNNVGRFAITAEVDRDEVKQGEPFTLTVALSGTGNINAIDPGAWPTLPDMRRYDPKVETTPYEGQRVGGVRRYEFLIIPERAGRLEVPAHSFHFFDPATERYELAETRPIAIEVADNPNAPAADPAAATSEAAGEAADAGAGEGDLFAPLFTPDSVPRALTTWDQQASFQRWLYGMLGVPATAAAVALARAMWRRFGPDEAARASAAKAARRRALVARAEEAVERGDDFYAAVGELLQSAAVERVGPSGYGLPRQRLLELLRKRGASEQDAQRLGALLDRCDAARFGAAGAERAEQRRAVLDEALALLRGASFQRGRRGS